MLSDKSFRLSLIISILFLLTGFAFLHYDLANYGWVIFVILPLVVGISTGNLPNQKLGLAGLALGVVIFFILLLLGQLEGFICVLMSLPVVVLLVLAGRLISMQIRKYYKQKGTTSLKLLTIPYVFFLLGVPLEKGLIDDPRTVTDISTEIILPYSPLQVYDEIKSVDTLATTKPWLMQIGLPVPQKCILEEEALGGLRTCYFEGGRIVEKITELQPGSVLRMDVIRYELTGRKWLGFQEAIYQFEELAPNRTKLTRITTYTSELKPRFYWQPLEELGIQQEHEYVFSNLKQDLKGKYGR